MFWRALHVQNVEKRTKIVAFASNDIGGSKANRRRHNGKISKHIEEKYGKLIILHAVWRKQKPYYLIYLLYALWLWTYGEVSNASAQFARQNKRSSVAPKSCHVQCLQLKVEHTRNSTCTERSLGTIKAYRQQHTHNTKYKK